MHFCDRTSFSIGREFAKREEYYLRDIDQVLQIHHMMRKAMRGQDPTSQVVNEDPPPAGPSELPADSTWKTLTSSPQYDFLAEEFGIPDPMETPYFSPSPQ